MATYQVVAECAHASVNTPMGKTVVLLYKGALVPEDAPQLQHLLEIGSVVRVDQDETGGVNADGVPSGAIDGSVPPGVTSTPVEKSEEQKRAEAVADAKSKADPETAERRAAARAKLPEDGSVPDGRAGKDVFVEFLAGKGYDYDELVKQDKPELVELAKQPS